MASAAETAADAIVGGDLTYGDWRDPSWVISGITTRAADSHALHNHIQATFLTRLGCILADRAGQERGAVLDALAARYGVGR